MNLRTDSINLALERTLSPERLRKYRSQGADLDAALNLYERNTRLSEAFYSPLQALEICLRNSLNLALLNTYGPHWFLGTAPLRTSATLMLDQAKRALANKPSHATGDLIAELRFAFWVGLLAKPYDATLWRRSLFRAFRSGSRRPRQDIYMRLNAVRRFRNRIAHHEPVFHRNLNEMHDEILEAIGWMCHDTRQWAAHHSRVPTVLAGP